MRLQRANTDGTEWVNLVVSPTSTAPIGMAVDTVNQKIYWTDQQPSNSPVMRADLDGSNPVTLVSYPTPVTIDRRGWAQLPVRFVRRP